MSAEVRTRAGRVRGEAIDVGVAFRGIPYAAPPVGPRRFRPPQPVDSWAGARDATRIGAGCRQPVLDPAAPGMQLYNPRETGDDCLNLNVWTPDPGWSGLPVMVWIHGGGFMTGGGGAPIHDGASWARDGIVFVSINYRMHAEGFLHLGGDTANLGLQDQVAALAWVQENIASFGGDPDNVTIFGQSAGAVSVMHLLSMPSAEGLFRRAIAQSGSSAGAGDLVFATRVASRLAELLGVAPTTDGFASVGEERLLGTVASLAIEYLSPAIWGSHSFMISPFRPVIDGVVLPEEVVPAVASGRSGSVDVMAGTTRDEMTFAMQPLGMLGDVDETWAAMALDTFGITDDALDTYRKVSRPGATDGEVLQAAWTDWAFRIPTIRLLEAHVPQPGATYCYEFAWPSPLPLIGATHALEVPFVSDRLATFAAAFDPADNPIGSHPPQTLADTMHGAWVDFATRGVPGWSQYDLADRTTMRFDVVSEAVDDLAGAERELWEGVR